MLRTYPSLKVWVAGCSAGEEAYSLAILLREEGLLSKTLIYATDINSGTLQKAAAGVYDVERIAGFTANHHKSGARTSLSDYYTAAYGRAVFDKSLKDHIVFSDHSLATDSVFAEVQLVSCRNVLIYFNRVLQDRALGLFRDALCRQGFLRHRRQGIDALLLARRRLRGFRAGGANFSEAGASYESRRTRRRGRDWRLRGRD